MNSVMKKIFTIIALAITSATFAQECAVQAEANYGEDESACKKNVSLYSEPLKQKNYKDAGLFWQRAQKACPQYKPNLYKNGVAIYSKLAKANKADEALRTAYADTLFVVYDQWVENFGDCYIIKMKWANDRSTYFPKDYENTYNKYKDAFAEYPEAKIKASWIQKYFASAYTMVKQGKAECDVLLETYDFLSGICDRKIKAGDTKFTKSQATLDKYVAPCASCDKLEELFKPKFENDAENVELMEKIVTMMGGRKCTDSEFYFSVVIALDAKKPSFKSKKGIGIKYYNDKDYTKAIPYFEEALGMTEDAEEQAKLHKLLANSNLAKGSGKQAVKWANNIGGAYAYGVKARAVAMSASKCGNSNVERSFAYCLALDYAEKAGGEIGSSTKSSWKQRLSTNQDLFFNGYEIGQEVTVSCWGEKTKVRGK